MTTKIDGGTWMPEDMMFEEVEVGVPYSGIFITFEGGEGSGKSTVIKALAEHLANWDQKHIIVNDPGGCSISQAIRAILLNNNNKQISKTTEMLLYQAARAQLFHQKILPLLQDGYIVLCDRFFDSTRVYQGHVRGWGLKTCKWFEKMTAWGVVPDLTIYLDVTPEVGLERSRDANCTRVSVGGPDESRFENEALVFHEEVRKGYQLLAIFAKDRIVTIDTNSATKEEVAAEVIQTYEMRV